MNSSPTNQKWAITKFFLLDNSRVHVNMLCQIDGTSWTFVSKQGGGIEGWVSSTSVLMVAQGSIPKSDSMKATWSTNAAAFGASDSMRANAATNAYKACQPPQPPDVSQPLRQGAAPPAPVPLGLGLSPAPMQSPSPAPPIAPAPPQRESNPMPSPKPQATVVASTVVAAPKPKPVANHALAAAMAAGFAVEPGQACHAGAFGMAPTAPPAFDESSEQTNCPGCGVTITPLNIWNGCCKSCKHRYGHDPLAPTPVRAAVAWGGQSKLRHVR